MTLTPISTDAPITLTQVKEHLRVFHDVEDNYIKELIQAAIRQAEGRTRRYIQDYTMEVTSSTWLDCIAIPKHCASVEVTEAKYKDADDTTHTFTERITPQRGRHGHYSLALPFCPEDFRGEMEIAITIKAERIPALHQAVLMLIGQWYENRGDQNIRGTPRWIDTILGTFAYQTL